MNISDYLIDSALVLLVLLQIRDRELTIRQLLRPLIILGIAIVCYLHGIPTGGNDLVLVGILAVVGGLIGVASGATVIFHRTDDGRVLFRAAWLSAFFWVLGMGSRFAFAYWSSHGGSGTIGTLLRPPLDHERRGMDGGVAGDGGVRGPRPDRGAGQPPPRARQPAADAGRIRAGRTPLVNDPDTP